MHVQWDVGEALAKVLLHCRKVLVNLLLHPIVCVYTHKCATNIVKEYEHSLVVE